jgi:cytochrome c-type biogenesis protein CcmE
MKKIHIIAILIIAIAFGVIMTSLSNNSTYASFKEADEHPARTFHIVGKLDKNKPFLYDAHLNTNLFTFYLVDREGTEHKVMLEKPKPDDFEHSEQIVVIGNAKGNNEFDAKDVLMKCPSKYQDGKPTEKQTSAL